MADEKSKRTAKSIRKFLDEAGTDLGRDPSVLCARMVFTETATGDSVEVSQEDLFGDVDVSTLKPSGVLSAWFGIKTNLGNAYGGKEATMEAVRARREMILDGEWSEGAGESGPRKTILAEAFLRAKAGAGIELSIEDCIAKVSSLDKEGKATLKEHAVVAFHYEEVVAEQRKEKLKKLRAAMKADDVTDVADL